MADDGSFGNRAQREFPDFGLRPVKVRSMGSSLVSFASYGLTTLPTVSRFIRSNGAKQIAHFLPQALRCPDDRRHPPDDQAKHGGRLASGEEQQKDGGKNKDCRSDRNAPR